jgi:hypothetical protein
MGFFDWGALLQGMGQMKGVGFYFILFYFFDFYNIL